jgi:FtsP/CotA-like multicopper oxidase with cupredoxin domain
MNKKNVLLGVALMALVAGSVWANSLLTLQAPLASANQVVNLKDGDTYTLTASYVAKEIAGKEQTMLAYNGMIPGPTIRVAQGAEVTINFKNDTDLPALLHSHGVRMDNAFDGSQTVQKDIPPGGSFAYKLKFPDSGVYWYHPHAYEVYEQPLGLYGAFVVVPTDPDYYPPVNRETTLFLSDLPVQNGSITLTKDTKDHVLMGHYGNVILVNGKEDYSLSATAGEVVRLNVVNAANTRPFNFAIAGAKLKVIGGDNGAYEKAYYADSVTLGPSERATIDVLFERAGTYALENKTPNKTYMLGTIVVGTQAAAPSYAAQFNSLQESTAAAASIDPLRQYFNKSVDKRIRLTVDMMGMGNMSGMGQHMMPDGTLMTNLPKGGIEWEDTDMAMMNQMSNTDMVKWNVIDEATGAKNMDIDWVFKRGEPVKIRITNDANSAHPMQHPMHFHGQRFLVLDQNGAKNTNLVWKDTVLIPAGQYVDILLDTSNPGLWMAHCHIAEHLQAGMMMQFRVE